MNRTVKKHSKIQLLYSSEDYNSNDGMLTSVWGPSMWHFLHTMSFNYPINPNKKDKNDYYNFVYSLRGVLPCGKCRKNLKHNFKKLPLKMSHMINREVFARYIFDLHELINQMLGKKSGLTYEIVRDRYEHFRARCTKDIKKMVKQRKTLKKHNGCIEPMNGVKSKCILKIVPQSEKCDTFQM